MRLDLSGIPAISVRLETDPALVATVAARVAEGSATATASAAKSSSDRVSRPKPLLREQQHITDAVEQSPRETAETRALFLATYTAPQGTADAAAEQAEDLSTQAAAPSVELRGHIESELARYFQYPPLARREGWEGVVQLQFDVAGDGAIRNIQLASSSGYALLDRAAQDALAKAGHVSVPPTLAGGVRAIALPVRYLLTEVR